MAKDNLKGNELALVTPQQQQAQYNMPAPYAPPVQPYIPQTQPITPSVSPVNPSLTVLAEDSVIIAPKKPPKSLRPITFKSLFWGIILLVLATFIVFLVGTYFFVDSWNPFRIIADFFTEFDFGKFFTDFFTGQA